MALTIEQLNELHSDNRRCAEMTGLVGVVGDEPGPQRPGVKEQMI